MQYNCPDIMCAFSSLSSYAYDPSAPTFQGFKHLVRYLVRCPCHPIIYPSAIDGTKTHVLLQEVSPGNFYSQNITNGLVSFSDG